MTLGQKLKSLREKRGWTQSQAAEKLGVSSQVVSNYERDYRSPDNEALSSIAQIYNCSLDWLLGVSEDPERKEEQDTEPVGHRGRAYYGGGDDWTEEERAMADAFIKTLRERKKQQEEK